jgi:hypothetical protein
VSDNDTTTAGDGGRDYFFAALAALLVLALILVANSGGNPLAAVAVVPALLALVVRAPVLPAVTVLLVCFFAAYPEGVPYGKPPKVPVAQAHFRIVDLVEVAAVVAYFVAAFRRQAYSLRALPPSAGLPDPPPRRTGPVAGDEFARGLGRALGLAFAAALAWQFLGVLAVEPLRVPPFRVEIGYGNDGESRFLLLGGVVGLGGLVLTLLTGYWAAAAQRPDAARQYLLDLGWRESRRELNRREKWRAWGRGQLAREPFRVPWRAAVKAAAFAAAVALAAVFGLLLLVVVLSAIFNR